MTSDEYLNLYWVCSPPPIVWSTRQGAVSVTFFEEGHFLNWLFVFNDGFRARQKQKEMGKTKDFFYQERDVPLLIMSFKIVQSSRLFTTYQHGIFLCLYTITITKRNVRISALKPVRSHDRSLPAPFITEHTTPFAITADILQGNAVLEVRTLNNSNRPGLYL